MDQVCLSGLGETVGAVLATVVTVSSAVVNFVPEPDKIDNKFLRFLSRAAHFLAFDIVTANKPK